MRGWSAMRASPGAAMQLDCPVKIAGGYGRVRCRPAASPPPSPSCVWTLLVWTTRIGNIWNDDGLTAGEKWGRTGLALSFTALALAVALRRVAPATAVAGPRREGVRRLDGRRVGRAQRRHRDGGPRAPPSSSCTSCWRSCRSCWPAWRSARAPRPTSSSRRPPSRPRPSCRLGSATENGRGKGATAAEGDGRRAPRRVAVAVVEPPLKPGCERRRSCRTSHPGSPAPTNRGANVVVSAALRTPVQQAAEGPADRVPVVVGEFSSDTPGPSTQERRCNSASMSASVTGRRTKASHACSTSPMPHPASTQMGQK